MEVLNNQAKYDSHISDDEMKNNFSILNIENQDNELIVEEFLSQNDEDVCDVCESCINCYYSNGKYCFAKHININEYTPLCWGYRDTLTLRVSDCFQDDDYDLDD